MHRLDHDQGVLDIADYERRRCAADSAYIRAPIVRFCARDR
jgi:hypothetical protein